MIQRYRKRPVVIEAWQWTSAGEAEEIEDWADGPVSYHSDLSGPANPQDPSDDWGLLEIDTLEGVMTVQPFDFIIRGVQGEFYPCRGDIFRETYEAVDES